VYSVQGELLGALLKSTVPTEQFAPLDHKSAQNCVVDLLLAVPRRIRDGCTDGPAIAHVDYIVAAITRVLGI
jgi:hypothetical protein